MICKLYKCVIGGATNLFQLHDKPIAQGSIWTRFFLPGRHSPFCCSFCLLLLSKDMYGTAYKPICVTDAAKPCNSNVQSLTSQ